MSKNLRVMLFLVVFSVSFQQQSQISQSSIYLTAFGTTFEPRNQVELLRTLSNVQSLIRCSMKCNQDRQCRTFDYDQSSQICRLFEGEFSTGTVITNVSLSSSRVGAIRYNTTETKRSYSPYNQTCDQCSQGTNRYLQCVNNTCQCPTNSYWNGEMCLNQLYEKAACPYGSVSCRQDLNLSCWNMSNRCVPQDSGELRLFRCIIDNFQ